MGSSPASNQLPEHAAGSCIYPIQNLRPQKHQSSARNVRSSPLVRSGEIIIEGENEKKSTRRGLSHSPSPSTPTQRSLSPPPSTRDASPSLWTRHVIDAPRFCLATHHPRGARPNSFQKLSPAGTSCRCCCCTTVIGSAPTINHYTYLGKTHHIPQGSSHLPRVAVMNRKQTYSLSRCPGSALLRPHRCPPSTMAIPPDLLCPNRLLVFLRLQQPVSYMRLNYYSFYRYSSQSAHPSVFTSHCPMRRSHIYASATPRPVREIDSTETLRPTYNTMSRPTLWTDSAADLHQTATDP